MFFFTVLKVTSKMVTVKFSHTRYRALGPELIPVYKQTDRRRAEDQYQVYCLVTEALRCEQLARGHYAALPR